MAKLGAFPAYGDEADEAASLPVVQRYAAPVVASADLVAAAADAVVADSGPLPAGAYRVEITAGFSGVVAAGKHLVAQHRNAANDANIHSLGNCPAGASLSHTLSHVVIEEDERIRVVVGPVAAALNEGTTAQIRAYLL